MYKKVFLMSIVFLFFAVPVFAAEQINSFDAIIQVNQDSTIIVTEKIIYNFGSNEKHGIYRDIPFKYKDKYGNNMVLSISDIKVNDSNAYSYNFQVSDSGKNKRIKIGDADKYVTGIKEYSITYKINRAFNYFENHDELYWNVTGTDWPVEIKKATAKLIMPMDYNSSDLKMDCFEGRTGSDKKCLSKNFDYSTSKFVKSINYASSNLKSGEGLTIVAGLPKGFLKQPSQLDKILLIVKDNWIAVLPSIVFIFMFILWKNKGKDPEGRGTIIAQFNVPDNLTPAEVGAIIDEKADNYDISADIINLAVKGYIKINRIEKDGLLFKSTDYLLEKLKEEDKSLNEYEIKLLDSLFNQATIASSLKDLKVMLKKQRGVNEESIAYKAIMGFVKLSTGVSDEEMEKEIDDKKIVKLSELTNKFYDDLAIIKKMLFDSLVDKGYFPKNPQNVKSLYIVIGVCVFFVMFFLGGLYGVVGVISGAISGIIIIVIGLFMPVKTKKGVLAREYIMGLKLYLRVAEKDRIKFHNAPEKNPKQFEKLLPFAMVLKVETDWAKQFKDIYREPPEWYSSNVSGGFSAITLSEGLNKFQSKANTTMASKPSSSASGGGSGFSGGGVGGGFGGGGGGSW